MSIEEQYQKVMAYKGDEPEFVNLSHFELLELVEKIAGVKLPSAVIDCEERKEVDIRFLTQLIDYSKLKGRK